MRFRLVPILAVAAIAAAAVFAAVTAKPANSFPSQAQACTTCHPTAPASTTVSATPSTATPAAGSAYSVTINLSGLTSSGDTGYWISNAAGTPAVSVFGGDTGTNQTSYIQAMTAPSAPGTYSYTVWCERGSRSSGQAKSTTYSIIVPAPAPAITSLTPSSGLAGSSFTIAGSNFGSGGTVSFAGAAATTSGWTAGSITVTVPAAATPGAKTVIVTSGGQSSGAATFTVNAPQDPPSGTDTTPPTTTASGVDDDDWYNHAVTIRLAAIDNSGGSGVASITYSVDGGAPITVSGSSATVTIGVETDTDDDESAAADGRDGAHSVKYFATDNAGNVELTHTLTVNIDTERPSTKAPRSSKVKRHRTATLRYEIDDATPNGGTAGARIFIKNRRGQVVKTLNLGDKPVNTPLSATFTCLLRAGTYTFRVYGTDRAGNTQASTATNTLTVSSGS